MSYLGIDIGGTKVAFRAESPAGEVAEFSFAWPEWDRGAPEDLRLLADGLAKLAASVREPITAAGVAFPATVDRTGRVVTWPGRPSWSGMDFDAALRALLPGVPARFADDGDLAALAEARVANCANLVYFGVGTGIGGGIVLDGRPRPGLARASCELGHLVVDRFGERCDCGRRGCVQAVASGPATLRRAARARGAAVTPAELRRGLANAERWAETAIIESAGALAAAVVSVGELCDPGLSVIGGGFATAMPGFVDLVALHVRSLVRPGHEPAPVRPAVLGGLSSLHGAVLVAREAAGVQSAEISSRALAASR
ncbi:ROK family protein [Saccharothrix sp. AJ9571]|nr:ROK family protein [Saccharothrix sp. AJ9571]